ncbi:MAG: response regulator [Candidatus Aenigmarchaeota archaeon]|nr:response regulator [Candidatus Aenigmarchaeota archaeon]
MLEEKLQPVLSRLREKQMEKKDSYEIVKGWFQDHEENLAESLADIAFVCELPHQERGLLTYPVVGNWVLQEMGQFSPQRGKQTQVYPLLRRLVVEHRFNNHHTGSLYDKPEEYNRMWDELNGLMLSAPEDSMPLHKLMKEIRTRAGQTIHDLPRKNTYTVDLGHGLMSPFDSFAFLTFYFGATVEVGQAKPMDLTIMVVDDQHPEEWYRRMTAVGFKEPDGQGAFYDCESALKALENGHYDVILTDLELGEGKMSGIEFVERAYKLQKRRGIKPRISVFSYNDQKLEEAEKRVGTWSKGYVFNQVNYNNKATFTAARFRLEVGYTLEQPDS